MKGTRDRRWLSRRDFLKLVGAAVLGGGALAGCAGKEGGGPSRLVFSHGPEGAEIWQRQIDRFNREHKGEIEVKLRLAPADTGQYFEMLRTQFQAGDAEVDVISGDVIWPAQFAAKGWISDLSDRFTEDSRGENLEGAIASNTYEGKVYGVPWFTDAGMLYYRKDLLEGNGISEPPETWDELKDMTNRVRRDSGTKFGFVFQGADYEGGVVNALEFIWTAGGDVLDPERPGRVVIADPRAVDGLEIASGMVEGGVSPEAVSSFKELEAYTVFLEGDAVFMRNWPFVYGLSEDRNISDVEPARIGVAELPTARAGEPSYSGLGGWNLMINAASEKADAAWEFISYLKAPERQRERALRGGYLPTLLDLYDDPEILDQVPVAALGKEAIRNARSRPTSPFYHDMSLAMSAKFHASLTGSISPERAASALQRELEEILERAETL